MKFDTLLLMFSIIYALGTEWSIPSCIIVICFSGYCLSVTLPKIWRLCHELKKNQE
nr:MAG TPA: hypothetical protein [Caudoviricetes sp.]